MLVHFSCNVCLNSVKVFRVLSEFILLDSKVIFWKHQNLVISFNLRLISNVWDLTGTYDIGIDEISYKLCGKNAFLYTVVFSASVN
jgi:hypothetical protein